MALDPYRFPKHLGISVRLWMLKRKAQPVNNRLGNMQKAPNVEVVLNKRALSLTLRDTKDERQATLELYVFENWVIH